MLRKSLLLLLLCAPAAAAPTFVQEPQVILASGVVQAMTGSYPTARLYYILGSTIVLSATSADGVTLTPDSGVRLSTFTEPRLDVSSITGLSIQPLSGGGFRMVYSAIGSTGTAYSLFSATSADGLAWANDTGTLLQATSSTTFIGFPSLVTLGTGDWRLYYIQDFNGGNDPADRRVFTALSANQGRNFTASSSQLLNAQAGELAAMLRTDNRVRLLYTAPLTAETTNSTLASALSSDSSGNVFSAETGLRFSTPSALGGIFSPFVARTTDTYSWRLYYNFGAVSLSTPSVYSAVTYAPDPVSAAPASVFRSPTPQSFTIKGDVFSPSPTVQLTGNGTINGTGVVRSDDQTITVNFATQGEALGFYNVLVTNNTGQTGTIIGGVTLDFPAGEMVLTDNLLRPRQGGRVQIDVTTFNRGRVTVRLLTLNGDLVATLFDQEVGEGTQRLYWSGTTASGNAVASGVYLVNTVAPRLNITQKIVVIK
jgi:hypothetical protein